MVKGRLNELNQYRWSSYRSYIGLSPSPEWLRTEEVLACFGGKRIRQREYRKYVETAIRSWVGKRLGGLDDSTVAQAVRRFAKRMDGSARLKKIYRLLEVKIAKGPSNASRHKAEESR